MKICRDHPSLIESESLGIGPRNLCFNTASGKFWCRLKFENTGLAYKACTILKNANEKNALITQIRRGWQLLSLHDTTAHHHSLAAGLSFHSNGRSISPESQVLRTPGPPVVTQCVSWASRITFPNPVSAPRKRAFGGDHLQISSQPLTPWFRSLFIVWLNNATALQMWLLLFSADYKNMRLKLLTDFHSGWYLWTTQESMRGWYHGSGISPAVSTIDRGTVCRRAETDQGL